MKKTDKVYVAGHRGLVGQAIVRALTNFGYGAIVTKTRQELDLMNSTAVEAFFRQEKPDYVFLAAAKVGGILANSQFGADFIYQNLTIQNNVLMSSYRHGVKKLLFLGSSCIYPKFASQPIKEDSFLAGKLEETNKPYAVAKIAGITLCQAMNKQYRTNYISCMPTNLYGPGDNFDLATSHVLPALIRRFHDARESGAGSVTLLRTGPPRRGFLHVDDCARACLYLLEHYDAPEPV